MTTRRTILRSRTGFGTPGPLQILPGGTLAVGRTTTRFDPDDAASLLSAHVQLLRQLLPQQREASIALRRDDITALADLLGESANEVIDRLGSLMGATTAQRTAMASLFAAGALVIGLAASGSVTSPGTSSRHGVAHHDAVSTLVVDAPVVSLPATFTLHDHVVVPVVPLAGLDVVAPSAGPAPSPMTATPADRLEPVVEPAVVAPWSAPSVAAWAPPSAGAPARHVAATPAAPDAPAVPVDLGTPPLPPAPPVVGAGDPPVVVVGTPPLPDPVAVAPPLPSPVAPPGEVVTEPVLLVDAPA